MNYDNVSTTIDENQKPGKSSGWTRAENLYARLPYIYLVIFLCTVYVFSTHQAEKKVRAIQSVQKDMTELKWEYTSLKADWMYSSTRSQISERVAPMDLRWTGEAPVIIETTSQRSE
ncbi:MAG: hypothetical protein EA409_05400 [Saprospirales bacterium]|nr:MAG: hypothetical protein EA409_05400 [Saprospirales bacterium]